MDLSINLNRSKWRFANRWGNKARRAVEAIGRINKVVRRDQQQRRAEEEEDRVK